MFNRPSTSCASEESGAGKLKFNGNVMRAMHVASAFQLPRRGNKQTLGGKKRKGEDGEGECKREVLVILKAASRALCDRTHRGAAIVPFTFEFPSRHRGNLHPFNGFNLPFNLHSKIDRPPFLFPCPLSS